MKQWLEKVKEFAKENPALAGLIVGVIVFLIYSLFKGGSNTEVQTPTGDMSAKTGPTPAANPGGGGGGDTTTPAIAGLFTAFYDNVKGMFAANQESQAALVEVMAESQADTRSLIEQLADKINGLSSPTPQPSVKMPPDIVKEIIPPNLQMWTAPISEVVGGSGGGMIVANKETIDNWHSGVSKSSGSGSADFSNWTSAGSKNAGDIESQLSGMSSSEKLSSLRNAGLIA